MLRQVSHDLCQELRALGPRLAPVGCRRYAGQRHPPAGATWSSGIDLAWPVTKQTGPVTPPGTHERLGIAKPHNQEASDKTVVLGRQARLGRLQSSDGQRQA